jgi:hypothetical protein
MNSDLEPGLRINIALSSSFQLVIVEQPRNRLCSMSIQLRERQQKHCEIQLMAKMGVKNH